MATYPNIKFYRRQDAPTSPKDGYIWFDTSNKRLKIYKNTGWEDYTGVTNATYSNNKLEITTATGTVSVDLTGLTTISTAINNAISNLDATVGSTSFNQNTDTAKTTAHVAVEVSEVDGKLTKVTVAENDIASAKGLSDLTGVVSDLSDAIDLLNGSDAGSSVRNIAIDVLTDVLVKDGAAEAYDTLQEMSAWIQNHPADAAAMNTKVTDLETAVSNLQKADSVTTFGGKTGAITLKSDSTTNGTVNFSMNNNQLTGTVYGLGSLAYKSSLSKSDVGLSNVDNLAASGYLTDLSSNTTNAVSITVGGTTKEITAAKMKESLGLGSAAYTASSAYATAAQGTKADSAYQKPSTGIPSTDLASAVQTSLRNADSALQESSIFTGTKTNGTITVGTKEVAVKGLGSAAYTDSSAYATSAQGGKADNALQSISSGNTSYLTVGTKDGNKNQSITPILGTLGDDSKDGLATTNTTAAYVNTYVDTVIDAVFSWAEY